MTVVRRLCWTEAWAALPYIHFCKSEIDIYSHPPFSFLLISLHFTFSFLTSFGHCDYSKGLIVALVSIATVQALIPHMAPCLHFRLIPLVPCPLAFQPNLISVSLHRGTDINPELSLSNHWSRGM